MKKLQDVIKPKFGKRITKSKDKGTKYPVYGGGGESFRTDNYNREDDYVISRFAISENNVRKVNGKFWLLDSGFTFEVIDPNYLKDFIFYYLYSVQNKIFHCVTESAQKNLNVKKFLEFEVPEFSLEKQTEIINILSAFFELIDLLDKEKVLRQKQLTYYLNELVK